MKCRFTFLIFFLTVFMAVSAGSQTTIHSPYLRNPDNAIGYVDSCAQFWLNTWDESSGGFYTNINKYGNVITGYGTNKNMLTQARNAYGLVRAFMLTGDTTYLSLAGKALNFMYQHAWDPNYGGWYQELDKNGNALYPFSDKTAFYQHYAMLGIMAYYEATGDTTAWNWLMKSYDHLEARFWDSRPAYSGYYDATNYLGGNAYNKSFNATVDAVTTHLLYLYLLTEEPAYKSRLEEMAQEMIDHLAASMPAQAMGFVEHYDSDWNWDNSETMTIMGHVLKSGWCLARIYQNDPDTSYISTAKKLIGHVWEKGYDHEFGGPYKDFNRVTGELLLWGIPDTTKAWWQMEQAVTAGLQMFDITADSLYLQMADESLDFFMNYFVDRQYGEVYSDRTRYGKMAWNEDKGTGGKAGYHSIELGYYTYLYGKLFVKNEPAILHYYFFPSPEQREILLTPLAIKDTELEIRSVYREGQNYTNFDSRNRMLTLPAGTGGHFVVTFGRVPSTIIAGRDNPVLPESMELCQNYPNPFNPTTTIGFLLPKPGFITLRIYDVLGKEVATLVSGRLAAGKYEYQWNAGKLASGIYYYRLQSDNFAQTRKLILLK